MSANSKKMLMAAAGTAASGGDPVYVEDVFSTYVYEGTNSGGSTSQTITNGIDLDGEGGMVWIKIRESAGGAEDHMLFDTDSPAPSNSSYFIKSLTTNSTGGWSEPYKSLLAWNNDGFDVGYHLQTGNTGKDYVSWTFRKAERFFDVVTYTGNGVSGKTLAHDLGCDVGMIVIKKTSAASQWPVYHSARGIGKEFFLNKSDGETSYGDLWVGVTSTNFTISANNQVNNSGDTYVAYLFADDPDGEDDDGMIACGTYNGTATANAVSVGWEPQYIMIKRVNGTSSWHVYDSMRGVITGGGDAVLQPDGAWIEEDDTDVIDFGADGFTLHSGVTAVNGNGNPYIYMAIRRPMKTPEAGTEVFAATFDAGSNPAHVSGFPVDMAFYRTTSSISDNDIASRLTGPRRLETTQSGTEASNPDNTFDYMNGWRDTGGGSNSMSWMFKRAPQFFDVVCYSPSGSAGYTVKHGLTVAPELIITKKRTSASDSNWVAGFVDIDEWGYLNETDRFNESLSSFYSSITATEYDLAGNSQVNASGQDYIAYLFATLDGISKIGSYAGNGTSQTIDCGFSGGARFVMVKCTATSVGWIIWDTTRGIVAGNDPHLLLNSTAIEDTAYDWIDPDSSGFIINHTVGDHTNNTGEDYVFLAIA